MSLECSGCHKLFKELNSGLKGTSWCDECFNYKQCAKCGNPITRNMVIVKTFEGKDYHAECFKCVACKTRIKKEPIVYDGKFYCQECGEPCGGCGKPIGMSFLEVFGKKWHEGCVKCVKCNRQIGDEQFYEEDGKPICAVCVDYDN
ncbi:Four and a half LIM domains protein, putative [Entamoeba dispar SAW760]|uniref:Four and a half LIM domains protein, putative n=1 Tax=Entamoeba dispar (strain ATCC PRA-260 / SAW760) TaxID=370354 RepID=B0ERL8_ENTDS|nr:Four and a half LIM domains protein, putative [Entamoeba dispar SAW760]EDR22822.1 Four and a half LIM domains protein, putative [Entamoeba dispar SAW760]|eukprot:EDR22822.1 Four and a half LIM domains protein, putative [Entamoeba dispar SAW760]